MKENKDKSTQGKNSVMANILKEASSSTSNKSYEDEDKKIDVIKTTSKKEKGVVGRKAKEPEQKKKARQVYYTDNEYKVIEECAELTGIEPKNFMQMHINLGVKKIQKEEEK